MVIPESCAVVGDELRSTKISPAASLTSSSDTQYSLAGITHMASIIDDIITNTSVTAQTGNAISQNTAEPVGSSAAGTYAASIATDIKNKIDFVINANGPDVAMLK